MRGRWLIPPCRRTPAGKTVKKVIVARGKLVSVVVSVMNRRTFLYGLRGCRRGSASCGYALAGRGSFLPDYIQTIGMPQFVNNTPYYVEQIFTERVRTEFINRGKYKVLPEAAGVDALLNGEIMSITIAPASFSDQQQASRYIILVTAKIEFRDLKTNKVLWDNPQWQFREEYEASAAVDALDPNAFFSQELNALDRVSTEFAKSVVSAILEAF